MQYVVDELENRGLKVDIDVIEAAVHEMNLIKSWEAVIEMEEETDGGEE